MEDGSGASLTAEPLDREVDILRRALAVLRQRLPRSWASVVTEQAELEGRRADALVEIASPDGRQASFVAEVKRSLVTRDLSGMLERMPPIAHGRSDRLWFPLVIARYLSPAVQTWLTERDVPYVDATGNMRISIDSPGLYLREVGATRDPWRGPGRPLGTLSGHPAARVVRALLDFRSPMSMSDLIKKSGASTGAAYRVVEFLEQETLVERVPRGPIDTISWRRLLLRWSKDYGFQRSNTVYRYLEPRGMPNLLDKLRNTKDIGYAVTGSLAAHQWAPYAAARLAMIHVDDPEQFALAVGLRPVDTGANVLLATGAHNVAFDRAEMIDEIMLAAPSQTAADLLTGPGRAPAEAMALLDWMEEHEDQWRR